jgi:hypothetical protein
MKFKEEEIYMIEELIKKKKVFYIGMSIFEKVTYFLDTIGLKCPKDYIIYLEYDDHGISLTEKGRRFFEDIEKEIKKVKVKDNNPVHTNENTNNKIKFFNTLIALEGKLK